MKHVPFAKITLQDLTDLHVKLGFYGGTNVQRCKKGWNRAQ